jgi:tetratricopeptide (TPR) repeat protein
MPRRTLLALVACAVGTILAISGAFAWVEPSTDDVPVQTRGIDPAAIATADDLDAVTVALQDHLRQRPDDSRSWAALGLAYVEQARVSGDASYYPKADRALQRSLSLEPDDNVTALSGQAALAAARHDFTAALRAAEAALAIDGYDVSALALRVDALTELGRYDQALTALSVANRRRPSLPIFARYSYAHELHGRDAEAAALLRRTSSSTTAGSDRAFLLTLLADLDRKAGRLAASGRNLRDALHSDPDHLAALASRARLAVAEGDLDAAERRWLDLVQRAPLPEYVAALGELYEATGRPAQAKEQYALLEATAQLAGDSGVDTDLETARYEADHGSAPAAVRAARAVHRSAASIWTADALAWALHAQGRDAQALSYAREATRLGTNDALLWVHRGTIGQALGLPSAQRHLRNGLGMDPGLSVWQREQARAALRAAIR